MRRWMLSAVLAALPCASPAEAPRDLPWRDPPAGLAHLLVLGTSLSHGETWPTALADRLEACTGTRLRVEVIARPGATSAWGADALAARRGPAPDMALVEFGVNDADLRRGLSAAASRRAHAEILARLDAVPVLVMRMNPAFGLRGLSRPRRQAREDALAAQAVAAGAGALDLDARWRARWRGARAMRRADMPDGLHPRPEVATAVIVPAIAAALGCAANDGAGDG